MHVFVTIPMSDGAPGRVHGFLTDLFASARPWPGEYWFVRTWEQTSGADCFQVSLASAHLGAGEAADRVRRVAAAHDLRPDVVEAPVEEVPSPLWNAGLGGPGFGAVARRLYRAAAPLLVQLLPALGGDPADRYRIAVRLMLANAGATLLESEQRDLPSRGYAELLSLRLLSYRSHYEGVYARATDPDSFERRYAAHYERLGGYTRDLVRSCAVSGPSSDDPVTGGWVAMVRRHFSPVRDEFRAGRVVNAGLSIEDLNAGRAVPLPPTRFHTYLSAELEHLLHRDPDFLAFRLATSLLYSCLHTLGFSLVERYLFCYLLARANEDVSGRETADLQRELGALARQLVCTSPVTP
ncbi:hypothetical protein ACWT_3629 [Actinoplanes sp. SE50]|uniref:hypothetical protein n=1 Tax=unclassified Actinoplanes TaxID=2626549 RepID=UPI00023EC481|nr:MULTISPECIES: hypothetical protein [unclassified Actinoplanes]AEV84652.1 hypothetical protein ACPL_3757 [Actinoplanes sp. SE50/110]ATO83044.1 hypothetical protein ACWT_3629 [Actinoplanes sp. SE50]SLM00452.1 hypothetical protein ACSP50_3684 [Actinoplanes sp. SE50/110]